MHFEKQERHDRQVELYITIGHAMVERCARVAEQWEREGYPGDFKTLVARIRNLKNEDA